MNGISKVGCLGVGDGWESSREGVVVEEGGHAAEG